MSGAFTRLGACIWDWEPFVRLDDAARTLWLWLYTSAESKRVLPGLFHGSISNMAEGSHRGIDVTIKALDAMISDDLVEYDQKHRVLRMCELPDAGEYPSTPNIMLSWWSRFLSLPSCQVRDAHVSTIRWILDQGARDSKAKGGKNRNPTGRPTIKHEEVWEETFGTIAIPPPRRRGTRRLVDSIADTSTAVQPSLFAPNPSLSLPEPLPPSSSPSDPEIKDLRALGSLPEGIRKGIPDPLGEGDGAGDGVGVGGFRDQGLGSGGPASGGASPSGASGGGDLVRPHLALVPPVHPYDALLLALAERSAGKLKPDVRSGVHAALCATIRELDAQGVGGGDLALLGERIARDHALYLEIWNIGGDPSSRLSAWAAQPGNVLRALDGARRHQSEAADASAHLAELKKTLGY